MRPWLTTITLLAFVAGCECGTKSPADASLDAQPPAISSRSARIVFLEGTVQVKRSGSMEWLEARPGMELFEEDKVRTGRNSFAQVQFELGGLLRMGPESLIVASDLRALPESQTNRTSFTLVEGMVEAELKPAPGTTSDFRIRTPGAEAVVLRREVAFQ
jgi:hypothetical protein